MKKTANFLLSIAVSLLPQGLQARPAIQSQTAQNDLVFIENKGQVTDQYGKTRKDIDMKLETPGMNIFIGDGAIHYQWNKHNGSPALRRHNTLSQPGGNAASLTDTRTETYRLDVELEGTDGNAVAIYSEEQPYSERYYYPQFGEGGITVHSYKAVTYKNVYPNIDWVLYIKDGRLKYDFIVHPGGNPAQIKLKYEGAEVLEMNDGAVTACTPFGNITENKPFVYEQQTGGIIDSKFRLEENNTLGFEIAQHEGTIVIDPAVKWGTYYGGGGSESGWSVAADPAGNAYLSGYTGSSSNIATTGAHKVTTNGGLDGFIAKLDKAGIRQWGTYFGSSGADVLWDIAYDNFSGNLYVCGMTSSPTGVATLGAHQAAHAGGPGDDALLAKFTAAGVLVWSTYYGGTEGENWTFLDCDNAGNVFMTGLTYSTTGIATAGTYQAIIGSTVFPNSDAFLVKFNSSGVRQWGTYYGGAGIEVPAHPACDPGGNVFLGGSTTTPAGLATMGAHQTTYGSTSNGGFIAKINGNNGTRIWGTYYGGTGALDITDIQWLDCDASGNLYFSGSASGNPANVVTPGAYKSTLTGGNDAFLAKFNNAGVRQWGTLFGGSGDEYSNCLLATGGSYIYLCGATNSSSGIATSDGYQQTSGGAYDAYFVELIPTNGQPVYSTYYGGFGDDEGTSRPAWSKAGFVYMPFRTASIGLATSGAHQLSYNANGDGFLVNFLVDTVVEIKKPFTATELCAGDSLKIPFTVLYKFNSANVFTAQLSNASGSFANPVNIGTKAATLADTLRCRIPPGTPDGAGYRIRIIASTPSRTSEDNGVNIKIKALPANVNAGSNSPVCSGTTLNLTATTTTSGTITYSWVGPLGFTTNAQNPNITNVSLARAGNYVVTVTSQGCSVKDTTAVVVNLTPVVPVAGSNSPVCPTHTINLTALSSTGGVSYSWTGPSFTSSAQNPGIPNADPASHNGLYSVTAMLGNCTSAQASTNVVVQNYSLKPVAGSNSPTCQGGDINLTATGSPGATFTWTGPSGFSSTLQNPVRSPAQNLYAGRYIVYGTVNSCVSPSDTVEVVVIKIGDIGAYASPGDTICENAVVSFVAVPSTPGTPSFQWYKNTLIVPDATKPVYTDSVISDGDMVYCAMDVTGIPQCPTDITLHSNNIKITVVNNIVNPAIHISSNPAEPMPGQPASFYAAIQHGGSLPSFQWQRNGKDVPGAIYPNWNTSDLHPYDEISCKLVSSDACASTKEAMSDTIIVNFPAGIKGFENNAGYRLFPNPNNGNFTLKGNSSAGDVSVEVVNAMGQTVHSETVVNRKGNFETGIHLDVAAGVYMLRIGNAGQWSALSFTVYK